MSEAGDTSSSGTPRKGGREFWPDEDGPRAKKRPGRPKLLFGAAGAVVAVAVVVVATVLLTGGGGAGKKAAAAAKIVPTIYTPDYSGSGFDALASRKNDKRPITKAEAFGGDAKKIETDKYTFTQAAAELTDCKTATWGERLHKDLAAHGCTQIGRAAYVSADGKYVGQFIVINMKNKAGVDQIMRDLDPAANAGWIKPLQPEGVPEFGTGFSAAYARSYGHYAVITWVERAGGKRPATLTEMIDVSLAIEKPAYFLWARLTLVDGGSG